jgi:hypothetical protein
VSTLKKIDALWRSTKEKLRDAKQAAERMLAEQIDHSRWDKKQREHRALVKARRIRYGNSVYSPHQGEREKARRRSQLARGFEL